MSGSSHRSPLISVAIPTRDRAVLLEPCLESLAAQTLPRDDFEVVVVDDGSTDGTSALCARFAEVLPLRYQRLASSGIAAAKNAGLFASIGETVLFFDDDDVAHPEMLTEHVAAHRRWPEPRIAILGYTTWHPSLIVTPLMNFVTEVGQHLFSYPSVSRGLELDFTHFWGGRSSVKRGFLLEHGVFNQQFTFGYEDIELGYRLSRHGFAVVYCPAATSYMLRPVTFRDFCERCERQGRSLLHLSELHHQEDSIQAYCRLAEMEFDAEALDVAIGRAVELERRLAKAETYEEEAIVSLHDAYAKAFRLSTAKFPVLHRRRRMLASDDLRESTEQSPVVDRAALPAKSAQAAVTPSSVESGAGTEIVFVHIPKTAGSAFRKLLHQEYAPHWETLFDNEAGTELVEFKKKLGRPPRVLTGHLPASTLLPRAPGARSITWLRDPVARTISTYFYWKTLPPQEDRRQWKVRSGETSLMEFASAHANTYANFWLAGYDLEDFDFVGIVEYADEDVADMARVFGWGEVALESINRTSSEEYLSFEPSPDLLATMRDLNAKDIEIYQRALELRDLRRAAGSPARDRPTVMGIGSRQ